MELKTEALEEVLSSFGSKLIEKARANLNKKDKRVKKKIKSYILLLKSSFNLKINIKYKSQF